MSVIFSIIIIFFYRTLFRGLRKLTSYPVDIDGVSRLVSYLRMLRDVVFHVSVLVHIAL